MRLPSWTPLLEATSGYTAELLQPCVAEMHTVYVKSKPNNLQAVREKYSKAKFLSVSTLDTLMGPAPAPGPGQQAAG